jgi:ATP-binding cassette, subfamily B, bacterial
MSSTPQNVELARQRLWVGSLLSLVSTGSYYAAYAYVIFRTVNGDLSWGSLQFLAGSIAGASTSIQSIFSTFSSIADQSLFLTDLVQFLRVKPTIATRDDAIPAPRAIRDGFRFEQVSFSYPGNARPIIDRMDFHLAPGERVALVGENGQGKTTLVKLITRLYDPTAGRVLLDGVDLRDYDLESLHREIGVIFQDFVRYEMTARENITVGRLEVGGDDLRIRKAARRSLAHDVIARLPARYDQLLGRRFDGGLDLSGGEWQKVALARAYLRDAQLLILDEPTAALDARAEFEVFDRFAELTTGKMALLISHRFSDRPDGRPHRRAGPTVASRRTGTHDSLMARGGRYAQLFDLQAASYR